MSEKINLNEVARVIAQHEDLKEQVSIAQIKEILGELFRFYSLDEIARIYFKYNK